VLRASHEYVQEIDYWLWCEHVPEALFAILKGGKREDAGRTPIDLVVACLTDLLLDIR
jgi:hypothetical protein